MADLLASAAAAAERVRQRALACTYEDAGDYRLVFAVEASVDRTLQVLASVQAEPESAEPGAVAEAICDLARSCVAVAAEAGLLSALVVELLCEGVAAAAGLLEGEQACERSPLAQMLAGLLEPLGAALDSLAVPLFVMLLRLEDHLQLRWDVRTPGGGGALTIEGPDAVASWIRGEVRLYQALQGTCFWALALATRATGAAHFTGRHLWDFASNGVLGAVLFAKCALGFEQWTHQCSGLPVPADFPELRDAILGALLSLTGQDIAFAACLETGADGDVPIEARNQALQAHRAALAQVAAECRLLDALLAYPWVTSLFGAARLPSLVGFLAALLSSVPSAQSDWEAQLLTQQVRGRAAEIWHLLASFALNGRGFLRDCAAIAHSAPPSPEACDAFVNICLSDASSGGLAALLADHAALAALLAIAANAGQRPSSHPLAGVLAHLDPAAQESVASRLAEWRGPVRDDCLASWLEVLNAAEPNPSSEFQEALPAPAPPTPSGLASPLDIGAGLRDLAAAAAPQGYCCALDGRLLVDPVRTPGGLVFERSVLARALEINGGICPVTAGPLTLVDCVRDSELRMRVLKWVRTAFPRHKVH